MHIYTIINRDLVRCAELRVLDTKTFSSSCGGAAVVADSRGVQRAPLWRRGFELWKWFRSLFQSSFRLILKYRNHKTDYIYILMFSCRQAIPGQGLVYKDTR